MCHDIYTESSIILNMHMRRRFSALVIRFSERILSKLATGEIFIFWQVSVADETDFSLVLLETK